MFAGSLPIVYGASNPEAVSPHPRSFLSVNDFPSPEALAAHLLYLAKNDSAYLEHFSWHKSGPSAEVSGDEVECVLLLRLDVVSPRCTLNVAPLSLCTPPLAQFELAEAAALEVHPYCRLCRATAKMFETELPGPAAGPGPGPGPGHGSVH